MRAALHRHEEHEDPYRRILRLKGEGAAWQVRAAEILVEAREMQERASRSALLAAEVVVKADALAERARSLERAAMGMLRGDQVAAKDAMLGKARRFWAESREVRGRAAVLQAEADRLSRDAERRMQESAECLASAKEKGEEAEGLRERL